MKKKWLIGILIVLCIAAVVLGACNKTLTLTIITENGTVTEYSIKKGDVVTSVVDGDYQYFTDAAHKQPFDVTTPIKEDTTLYVVGGAKCVITFVTNGGTAISPVTVNKGDTLPSYVKTTRAHYAFGGWYTDSSLTDNYKLDVTTPITQTMTLYAKWNRTEYVVTLKASYDDSIEQFVYVSVGDTLSLASLIDKFTYNADRYHFLGWRDASGKVHASTETLSVSDDITLTAVFEEQKVKYEWDSDKSYYVVVDMYDKDVENFTVPASHNDGTHGEHDVGAIKYLGNSFRLKSVTVPDSVVYVYEGAFRDLAGIVSIDAPFIGEHKFTALPTGNDFIGNEGMFGYWFQNDESGVERAGFTAVPAQYKEFFVEDGQVGPHETFYYIPNSLTTVTVRGGIIPAQAFYNQTTIHKLVLGADVTAIGEEAFSNNSKIENLANKFNFTEVEFVADSQFTTFREKAFLNNYSLEKINIPNKVQILPDRLFYSCPMLQTVTFDAGSTLTTIGEYAFYISSPTSKSSLQNITLPDSLTTIKLYAFGNCNALLSITIPAKVTTIAPRAFQFATSLQSVIFASGNSMTALESKVFEECHSLTTVKLPDTMSVIGNEAFNGCSSLRETQFDFSKINEIGNSAFQSTAFQTLTIPSNVKVIGSNVFALCDELESVTFEGDYTTDKSFNTNGMFDNCVLLTSVNLPKGLPTIGSRMFINCTNLEQLTVPASVTSIGDNAFGGTSGRLRNITFETGSQLTSIGDNAFWRREQLEEIHLPATIKKIGANAFVFCENLTTVTFAEGASGVEIGNDAFRRDYKLVINDWSSIKSIGNSAFEDCSSQNEVTLPNSIEYIGSNAFYRNNGSSVTVNLNLTFIEVYKKGWPTNWNGNATINYKAIPDGQDGMIDDANWEGFFDSDSNKIIVTKYIGSSASVSLPDTLEYKDSEYEIIWADRVFEGNKVVQEVHLALTQIPDRLFAGCTSLEKVVLHEIDGLTRVSIGASAFENCTLLSVIELTANVVVVEIGSSAFVNTPALKSFDVQDSTKFSIDFTKVESIGSNAFNGKREWTQEIHLSSALTYLGAYAFYGCQNLTVHLNDAFANLTEIPERALSYVRLVVGEDGILTIPNNITFVGRYAFSMSREYGNITAIVIDANNELHIEDAAFMSMGWRNSQDRYQKIAYILVKGTPAYLGYMCFGNNWCGATKNDPTPVFFADVQLDQADEDSPVTNYPEDWDAKWYLLDWNDDEWEATYRPVYGKGTWHYEDGVPTIGVVDETD